MIPKADDVMPQVRRQSDFFSWQLYRYLKKYTNPLEQKIYSGTWNSVDGVNRNYPVLYIGFMDDDGWFHGRSLRNLCSSGSKIERYAYHHGHDTKNWKDVTDEFWSDYMKMGVCAIHDDLAHNWDVDGNTRICAYCRKTENRSIVLIEKEVWS